MDCEMPVMDGFETSTRIRANEESQGKSRTPILISTADIQGTEPSRYRKHKLILEGNIK